MLSLARRRFGNADWDAAIRATGVVGIVAIPLVLLVPRAEALVMLVLAVLWLRSPAAAFSMVGLEPLLMLYGRLYPVWLVVTVATTASIVVEIISLRVMRGVLALRLLEKVRGHVRGSRLMALFTRRPAVAVAVAAFSPIPDWVTRSIGAVAKYPVVRYVAADTLGRLPKIWIPVALGSVFVLPPKLLLAVSVGSVGLGAIAAVGHFVWATRRGDPRRGDPCGRPLKLVKKSLEVSGEGDHKGRPYAVVVLLALLVSGCVAPWTRQPVGALSTVRPRAQVQVWRAGAATRLHAVRITDDSITGVPFLMSPGCDSCRVGIARADVDSVRTGNPEANFLVPLAVVMAVLTVAFAQFAASFGD